MRNSNNELLIYIYIREGRLLVIGFTSGRIPSAPANLALLKSCDIVGVFWGAFVERTPKINLQNFEKLYQWIEEGYIKPRISMKVPLENTLDAMQAHILMNRVLEELCIEQLLLEICLAIKSQLNYKSFNFFHYTLVYYYQESILSLEEYLFAKKHQLVSLL